MTTAEAEENKCNTEKTDIYNPAKTRQDPFVTLGCDLANTRAFVVEQISKHDTYFDTLHRVPLHPQLKLILVRLCGAVRIKYLASVMPTATITDLINAFDKRVRDAVFGALRLGDGDMISDEMMYNRFGVGLPDYKRLAGKLFSSTRDRLLEGAVGRVELVNPVAPGSHLTAPHNHDADWLWYDGEMTPATFIAAYCIRLGILPEHLRVRGKCACGQLVQDDHEQIAHFMKCDRFTTCARYAKILCATPLQGHAPCTASRR